MSIGSRSISCLTSRAWSGRQKRGGGVGGGSVRRGGSRGRCRVQTKGGYDETRGGMAEMALLGSSATPLSGKALDYASESFKVAEAGRARSLLDMLGEVN